MNKASRALASSIVLAGVLFGSTACYTETEAANPPASSTEDKLKDYADKADELAGKADDFLKDLEAASDNSDTNTAGADYDRDEFGTAWADVDDNGCDTRNDILARDLTDLVIDGDDCTVLFGTLNDPYTGQVLEFERGHSNTDIDHIVALSAAWQMGADSWTDETRLAFANDPENLMASYMGANRSKGDDTLSEWMPENEAFQCDYATMFVNVATKYDLNLSSADAEVAAEVC